MKNFSDFTEQDLENLVESCGGPENAWAQVQEFLAKKANNATNLQKVDESIEVKKQKTITFWKTQFNTDIPETDIIPPQPEHLSYLSWSPEKSLRNCDEVLQKYKEQFGEDNIYCYYDSIDESIQTQQDRTEESYWYWHKGEEEPDKRHRGKSYDVFSKEETKYMIPFEGIVFAYEYRLSTGKMLDIDGVTYFHALYSGGNVILMCENDSEFYFDYNYRNRSNDKYGPREISFKTFLL